MIEEPAAPSQFIQNCTVCFAFAVVVTGRPVTRMPDDVEVKLAACELVTGPLTMAGRVADAVMSRRATRSYQREPSRDSALHCAIGVWPVTAPRYASALAIPDAR